MRVSKYIVLPLLSAAFLLTAAVLPVQAEDEDESNDENRFRSHLPEQASARAHQVQECLQLSRVLRQGASGKEVEDLQRFLDEEGHFDFNEITGYFGPITERALQRFQAAEGIVTQGDPQSTGYGQAGPKTMAQIAKKSCLTGRLDRDESDDEDDDDDAVEEDETVEDLQARIKLLQDEIARLQAKIDELLEDENTELENIDEARASAETWMEEQSPTYTYDGSDLELTGEEEIDDVTFEFTFEFQSAAAGYGDRTDQMLAQVITDHTTVVRVENNEVVSAITDEVYDELNDEMLEDNEEEE